MAWTTKEYVFGIVLFSAVIALFYLAVGDMATSYDRTDLVDESFSENYNQLDENADMIEDMRNKSRSSSGLSIIGTAEILISSTFSIIELVFGSLDTFAAQVGNIGDDIGIPSEVENIIGAVFLMLLVVSIVLIVINAVNKTEKL